MATTIVWTKRAKRLFIIRVRNAYLEFGLTTSRRWQAERKRIEDRLMKHPESYTREYLLSEKRYTYRSCHIMRRFKLVYYYARTSNTVHIVDIWDTMMNPETLKNRI